MSDLIRKSALVSDLCWEVVDAAEIAEHACCPAKDYYTGIKKGLAKAAVIANKYPTVEAEKGKWIFKQVREYPLGYDEVKCSLCGFKLWSNPDERFSIRIAEEMLKFKYCPMCGHPMEGDNGEIH